MKHQEINTQAIEKLMDVFYAKIRADKSGVGDIFNTAIGTSDEQWNTHKQKIANFWSGLLLGIGDYNGQPLKAHLDLPPFPREFFGIWLRLFEGSLDSLFEESPKTQILQKAQMIAQRFQVMLYEMPH